MIENYNSLLRKSKTIDLLSYLEVVYIRQKSAMTMNFLFKQDQSNFENFLDPPREILYLCKSMNQDAHLVNAWGSLFNRDFTRKKHLTVTHYYGDHRGNSANNSIMDDKHLLITDNMFIFMVHNKVLREHGERIGITTVEFKVPVEKVDFISPLTYEEVRDIVKPSILFYKLKYPNEIDLHRLL